MNVELELTIDENSRPIIKIRHHDKSSELEQKLLGVFVKDSLKNGIFIKRTPEYLECGTSNSHENYEIHIKQEDK